LIEDKYEGLDLSEMVEMVLKSVLGLLDALVMKDAIASQAPDESCINHMHASHVSDGLIRCIHQG